MLCTKTLNIQPSAHTLCVFYLRTNSDLCRLQHKLIGFYSRHEKCARYELGL